MTDQEKRHVDRLKSFLNKRLTPKLLAQIMEEKERWQRENDHCEVCGKPLEAVDHDGAHFHNVCSKHAKYGPVFNIDHALRMDGEKPRRKLNVRATLLSGKIIYHR